MHVVWLNYLIINKQASLGLTELIFDDCLGNTTKHDGIKTLNAAQANITKENKLLLW